jgi:hypothetical protein
MWNRRHPNFILGLVAYLFVFIGIGLRANGYREGDYVIGFSALLGAIHWIWSIIDVLRDYKVNSASENRILWVILVIIIPPVGGLLYYAMSKTVRI